MRPSSAQRVFLINQLHSSDTCAHSSLAHLPTEAGEEQVTGRRSVKGATEAGRPADEHPEECGIWRGRIRQGQTAVKVAERPRTGRSILLYA